MPDAVAPVSGPPLVYPIQPVPPVARKDGQGDGLMRVGDFQAKAAPAPNTGRLLDITV